VSCLRPLNGTVEQECRKIMVSKVTDNNLIGFFLFIIVVCFLQPTKILNIIRCLILNNDQVQSFCLPDEFF
jgi:hypothetical protein